MLRSATSLVSTSSSRTTCSRSKYSFHRANKGCFRTVWSGKTYGSDLKNCFSWDEASSRQKHWMRALGLCSAQREAGGEDGGAYSSNVLRFCPNLSRALSVVTHEFSHANQTDTEEGMVGWFLLAVCYYSDGSRRHAFAASLT